MDHALPNDESALREGVRTTPETSSPGPAGRARGRPVGRARLLFLRARNRFRGMRPRYLAIAAVVLGALAYGAYEIYMRLTHVYEYDARVTADMVVVSSRTDGWVVDMPAKEGMKIDAAQTVVKIDDRVSRLRADALRSQLQAVQADRDRLKAERRMADIQIEARFRARTSAVAATAAAGGALQADLLLATQELERTRALYDRRVITDKQLQTAQAAVSKLESQIAQMAAELKQAEGGLDEAVAERARLGVLDLQISALDHIESNLDAQLGQQLVDLEDRTVRSPVPAVIDRTFVQVGEYVAAGQRILILHNPAEVWVEANIKETQIRKLRLGQTVLVAVDAYPGERFVGRVGRIGSATTARFALLPTPNPSGNFTKITQRVPVKIDMVEMPKPLAPGMMVDVNIDVR
jgi:membrane fusion protein (multidrug efflux system)